MTTETHAAWGLTQYGNDRDCGDSHHGNNGNANANGKPIHSPATKRACDCCRKRKVRCDGADPCGPCKKASLRCAYLQPPKKKGPKGLRSARVLHALRRIDDTASSQGQAGPQSPEQPFGNNWGWGTSGPVPPGAAPYNGHRNPSQPPEQIYGPPTSVAPDQQPYYQHTTSYAPHGQAQHYQHSFHNIKQDSAPSSQPHQRLHPTLPIQRSWTGNAQNESGSGSDGATHVFSSPAASEGHSQRVVPTETFLPYVQLFFSHLYMIMPVIDRAVFLDPSFYSNGGTMNAEAYAFLCSLCATTVVQLDDSIPQPPPIHPSRRADALFAEECLRERGTLDYIEHSTPMNIMTSFFLFCYYGNHERHNQAWFFLQESITLAENLGMDDEASYDKLEPAEAQWRRRLYWLLFITERAYAVQVRKRTRLNATVTLPAVFESEDPQLLNGFVNLANLFSAVDDAFVSAWRGSRRASLCDEAWLVRTQKQLDETAQAAGMGQLTETQHLDISVTREWLHVLAWQMGVSNGLIWGQGEGGMRLDYPVELARKVVEITSGANALALDAHGIGMEQKLSDIAGCLADVLKCTAGDTSATFIEGKQYLDILLQRLSSIRGKESRYLKPLMAKIDGLLGYEHNNTLPPPNPAQAYTQNQRVPSIFAPSSPQWSMRESVSMLRTLSMCGNLGMPGIAVAEEDWGQRRPSGRVLEEHELGVLQPWLQATTSQAM